jgi:hypothetical protein
MGVLSRLPGFLSEQIDNETVLLTFQEMPSERSLRPLVGLAAITPRAQKRT